MKGYYSISSMNSYIGDPPKLSMLNDSVSPDNSAIGDTKSRRRYRPSPEESILMRCLRSGLSSDHDYCHKSGSSTRSSSRSPLSAVENFDLSPALVKVEEDVLVMDGILVDSMAVHGVGGNFRSPTISDSRGNLSLSPWSSSGSNLYKTELCTSWEDTGACCYGHKCQFAHGKEEMGLGLIPSRVHYRNKSKLYMSDPHCSPQSSTFSSSSRFALETMTNPSPGKAATQEFNKAVPIQSKVIPTICPKVTSPYWSPLDDGITVTLPFATDEAPSREVVDEHICSVLSGPTQNKRLPVFLDIFSE